VCEADNEHYTEHEIKLEYYTIIVKRGVAMILFKYFSQLNRQLSNTATFSDGGLRYGWTPPNFHLSQR